jgi:nucleoside-diphosphate-sugar epimerase
MAGTCAEYDWKKLEQRPIKEDAPLGPATPYAVAKHGLHHVLAATAAAIGFSYAWGRLFFMIGAGEHPGRLVPSVAQALLAGKPAKCTSGLQVRDFIDARDAGAAFAALLESNVTGAVNIASGEPHSVADVALTLGHLTGRADLVRLGALPDRPDDPPYLVADTTRLTRDGGFRPAIRFDVMLADALEWWRQRTISP